MSTLTSGEIKKYMEKPQIKDRLIVTPFLNPKDSIDPSSIDVRLGPEFIIFNKQALPFLDLNESEEKINTVIAKSQERVIVNYGEKFILHPRQYVIGGTFEYIKLPSNLMCYVVGKSTLGRMGLIIATATKIDPGFRGCITLEILNEGEVPLVLYPGMPIAQLVFHETKGNAKYEGVYDCPTGPIFPKFEKIKKDLQFWIKL